MAWDAAERGPALELLVSAKAVRLGGAGLALGVLLFSTVMAPLVLTRHARLLGGLSPSACALTLFAAVFAAIMEEILFRACCSGSSNAMQGPLRRW